MSAMPSAMPQMSDMMPSMEKMMGMMPMMGGMMGMMPMMMMCQMSCTVTDKGMTCEMKPMSGMPKEMFMECCKRMMGMMDMGMPMMMACGGMLMVGNKG